MYFKKASIVRNLIMAPAVCISLFSCGSGATQDQESNAGSGKDKDSASSRQSAQKDEPTTTFTLPSPLQIASIFKKAGLVYYPNICNSPENASKYNSGKMSQALNLGVYSADLSYCALNKQNQDSKNYMKASRELASQLGLEKVFETDNLANRFESNLGKDDSMAAIIADMQMQTDMILEEHEQEYISTAAFAGAWIESVYIGGKVYEKGKEKNVSMRLMEQMAIADNIVRALKASEKKDAEIASVITDINAIRDIYKDFAGIKALAQSQEDMDFSKIQISEEELGKLTKKIDEIRSKIVKG
jgi:hypothetical protein